MTDPEPKRGPQTIEWPSHPEYPCALEAPHRHVREAARLRDRRAVKTGAVGVVVQMLSRGIQLLVIPISIKVLGVEQYGLWLVVGSLVAWGGVTDLGFAPGLLNVVATAQGRGDRDGMRRAISTALVAYLVVAGVVAGLALALSRSQSLPWLLGVRGQEAAQSTRMLVLVCGLIFAASTITRTVGTTARAVQEGYLSSYSEVAGSSASLGLLFVIVGRGGGLLAYALVVSLPPLIAQVGLAAYIFGFRYPWLKPAWKCCDTETLRTLWGFAGPLTVVQLSSVAGLYSANLLIANRLGAAQVPNYAVPYGLFAAINGLIWTIISPYIPAIAEAAGRGDWNWIRKRLSRLYAVGVGIAILGGGVLVAGGNLFLRLWTGGTILAGMQLMLALYAFSVLDVSSAINSVVLQGLGFVRLLAWAYCSLATAVILGAWLLLPVIGLPAFPLVAAAGAAAKMLLTVPRAMGRMRAVASIGAPQLQTT